MLTDPKEIGYMNARFNSVSRCALAAVALLALAACAPSGVSYSKDVQPILGKNCSDCHAPGKEGFVASGLDMTSYQTLMKGGRFGPMVKPGDALSSALNMLVEGRAHPSIRMPHGREKLPAKDIETLKAWVNEGAKNN
ncbi:MAG: c-type cytochrome domain-containing protein [Pseudomonadota bacterium]